MVPSGFHTTLSSERGLQSFTIRKEFSLPLGEIVANLQEPSNMVHKNRIRSGRVLLVEQDRQQVEYIQAQDGTRSTVIRTIFRDQ